jgi:hypothetical protein
MFQLDATQETINLREFDPHLAGLLVNRFWLCVINNAPVAALGTVS